MGLKFKFLFFRNLQMGQMLMVVVLWLCLSLPGCFQSKAPGKDFTCLLLSILFFLLLNLVSSEECGFGCGFLDHNFCVKAGNCRSGMLHVLFSSPCLPCEDVSKSHFTKCLLFKQCILLKTLFNNMHFQRHVYLTSD